MFAQVDSQKIVVDRSFQGLCCRPFYGHPKGCPNFGKKEGCPPCKFIEPDFFDFSRDLFVIYTAFKVGEFAERMRQEHPEWKDFPRQWYNPRRWQPQARAMHRRDIQDFISTHQKMISDSFPEAHGVNCTELMRQVGIELKWEWPPAHVLGGEKYKENLSYVISLAGHLRNSHR